MKNIISEKQKAAGQQTSRDVNGGVTQVFWSFDSNHQIQVQQSQGPVESHFKQLVHSNSSHQYENQNVKASAVTFSLQT
jgi:hypothetical protein